MSSAADLSASTDVLEASVRERSGRPRPLSSLLSSAHRITSRDIKTGGSFRKASSAQWQEDAWEMYDLVGEQRFLASTLAGRMSQAKFYVGRVGDDPLEVSPEPVEDEDIQSILSAVGNGAGGRAQLIARLGINLFVAGDGWLVGIPSWMMPGSDIDRPPIDFGNFGIGTSLDDLEWRMMSVTEVTFTQGGKVTLMMGDSAEEKVEASADDLFLIRVWRPHPRRWWEADSPTRSSLPVLRELVGLTMHISAQVDSRLAGAGLLIVPQSAQQALRRQGGDEEDDESDPFTEALMEAMLKPIEDRSSASALVPLIVVVPDEAADKFQHITFAKPLDTEARSLRDEAIRRLALGQDAPPELLLGVGGMNHWGAWLVREDVVTTHIEPPLGLICDALTTQYLRPVLQENGYSQEEAEEYVVWYDVSHMIMRPNRAADAMTLYDKGVLSDEAVREASGFDDNDAPETSRLDLATLAAYEIGRKVPQLAGDPGLVLIKEQFDKLLYPESFSASEASSSHEVETLAPATDLAAEKALEIVMRMPQLLLDPGLEAVVAQVRSVLYPDGEPPVALPDAETPAPIFEAPDDRIGGDEDPAASDEEIANEGEIPDTSDEEADPDEGSFEPSFTIVPALSAPPPSLAPTIEERA